MNPATISAFFDELTKIADWTLAGPEGLGQFSATQIAGGQVPEGARLGPSPSQQAIRQDYSSASQVRAEQLRAAKMQQLYDSGAWNPQTHSVDAQGNVVPRKTAITESTSVQRRKPPASTPVADPYATQKVRASQVQGAPVAGATPAAGGAAPSGVKGFGRRVAGGLSRMGRLGKAGLGVAALGLTGLGGYEAGQPG